MPFLKRLQNCVDLERKRVRVIDVLYFFTTEYIMILQQHRSLMNDGRHAFVMRDNVVLRRALTNARLDLTLISDVMKKFVLQKATASVMLAFMVIHSAMKKIGLQKATVNVMLAYMMI